MKQIAHSDQSRPFEILLSPGFLLGLGLLLLNDFYLKQTYGNFLTGKLSDFAGLFTFSLFLSVLIPNRPLLVPTTVAAAFVFWKTPLAAGLIDSWNNLGVMSITRTVDYSDLVALTILPLSLYYFNLRARHTETAHRSGSRAFATVIALVSLFAFTATSMADERTIDLEKEYVVDIRISEIRTALGRNPLIRDVRIERETDAFPKNEYPNVKTDPNTWFVNFTLDRATCKSNLPQFRFVVTETTFGSRIYAGFVKIRCADELMKPNVNSATKNLKTELIGVFESEVLHLLVEESGK